MSDNKKESPCKYCVNIKHDTTINKCYELCCIGYSRFQPAHDTPVEILNEVEDTHESYLW